MKKTNTLLLAAFFILIHVSALATDWNKPDKGYFRTQKDIEKDVSNLSASMATISFEGKLFNFINYMNGVSSKIIVRELTNTAAPGSGVVMWKYTKRDNIANLKGLSGWLWWQPSPVIFKEELYLFVSVQEGSDYHHAFINFTKYNAADSSWTKPQKVPGNIAGVGYMAATVMGDKLCLITAYGVEGKGALAFYTTTDLVNWTTFQTDLKPLHKISVITKSFLETNDGTQKLNSKLEIGYIDYSKHAYCAEFQFNVSNGFTMISNQLISNEMAYQSVVLADGSVTGDTAHGNMVQAFLKKGTKDNGYCRYRIQRYQKILGGTWAKQENNLVKQNYLWADEKLNLTAANFAVTDGDNIRQFICLIYRGYDDFDHPLNCAYVETDKMILNGSKTQTLSDNGNIQYIGFIEGPPPFYVNDTTHRKGDDAYRDPFKNPISDVEYTNTVSTTHETELGFDVGIKASCMYKGYKASVAYNYGKKWGTGQTTTKTNSMDIPGAKENHGYYYTLIPNVIGATYFVYDVHGTYLYPTYYFYLTEPNWHIEPLDSLYGNLNPSAPETYMNRKIPFHSYNPIDKDNVSWASGSGEYVSVAIEKSKTITNTQKITIDLSKEWGVKDVWSVGVELEGSLDFETTTTTLYGDEIKCSTYMNDAFEPTDVTGIDYNVWWLQPVTGLPNWWLHLGQDPTQNTWCVTYEVTYLKLKNGSEIGNPAAPADLTPYIINTVNLPSSLRSDQVSINTVNLPGSLRSDQVSSEGFSLSQNYPNPFSAATKIKYLIGTDRSRENSTEANSHARLVVYNLSGKEVATLVNENKAPGSYEVNWDASQLTPGVYIYSLQCGSFKDVKKLILLK